MSADDPALTAEQSSMEGVMRLPEGMCSNAREGIHSLLYSQQGHVPAEEIRK